MPNIEHPLFHHKIITVEIRITDVADPYWLTVNQTYEMWKQYMKPDTPLTIELKGAWIQDVEQEPTQNLGKDIPGKHVTTARLMVKNMRIRND